MQTVFSIPVGEIQRPKRLAGSFLSSKARSTRTSLLPVWFFFFLIYYYFLKKPCHYKTKLLCGSFVCLFVLLFSLGKNGCAVGVSFFFLCFVCLCICFSGGRKYMNGKKRGDSVSALFCVHGGTHQEKTGEKINPPKKKTTTILRQKKKRKFEKKFVKKKEKTLSRQERERERHKTAKKKPSFFTLSRAPWCESSSK